MGVMVVEAGVVAGYVIAWAVRKAKRVGGRLDTEADRVIDASLDRLHEAVAAKLSGHPALAELVTEAETSGDADGVDALTRQQVELALTAAARKDELFGREIFDLVSRVREAEQAAGGAVTAGSGSAVFTGDPETRADHGGIAFGQVAGNVYLGQSAADPQGGRERFRPVPDQTLGAPPDLTVLGGIRGKNALRRAALAAMFWAVFWFGWMAVFLRVQGFADLRALGVLALGGGLLFGLGTYLFALRHKSDTFTFDRER